MNWKAGFLLFVIVFTGFCALIKVDQQCLLHTGTGGKAGLTLHRGDEGNVEFCFFGLEGEIGL